MLKGLKNIINPDEQTIPEVGNEELFSIESKVIKDVAITEGHQLIAIEDLNEKEVSQEELGVESLIIKDENTPPAPYVLKEDTQKPGNTLFIKDETNIFAYLYGECSETLDTLVHILFQADKNTNVFISYCSPYICGFEILEFIGAVGSTKANVTLKVCVVDSALDLLLFSLKNINITLENGITVSPINDCAYGTTHNIQTVLNAMKDYQATVYSTLVENNILTEIEEKALSRDGKVFFISKEDFNKRIGK